MHEICPSCGDRSNAPGPYSRGEGREHCGPSLSLAPFGYPGASLPLPTGFGPPTVPTLDGVAYVAREDLDYLAARIRCHDDAQAAVDLFFGFLPQARSAIARAGRTLPEMEPRSAQAFADAAADLFAHVVELARTYKPGAASFATFAAQRVTWRTRAERAKVLRTRRDPLPPSEARELREMAERLTRPAEGTEDLRTRTLREMTAHFEDPEDVLGVVLAEAGVFKYRMPGGGYSLARVRTDAGADLQARADRRAAELVAHDDHDADTADMLARAFARERMSPDDVLAAALAHPGIAHAVRRGKFSTARLASVVSGALGRELDEAGNLNYDADLSFLERLLDRTDPEGTPGK